MSAFVVSRKHIDYLVAAALEFPTYGPMRWGDEEVTASTADAIGLRLLTANIRSCACRYPSELFPLPKYHYSRPKGKVDPVQVLKAIQCLDYQCCEVSTWDDSQASRFLADLMVQAIYRLPGYDAAQWEIVE